MPLGEPRVMVPKKIAKEVSQAQGKGLQKGSQAQETDAQEDSQAKR